MIDKFKKAQKEVEQVYKLWKDLGYRWSTDSRILKKRSLFIALEGINYDGHHYVNEAIDKKASLIIVHKEVNIVPSQKMPKIIRVKDTKEFLLALARYHRMQMKAQVILVAGSVAKTTTRYLISQVLSTTHQVVSTEKNQNNELGVAFSILQIREETEFAIIEGGARRIGDYQLIDKVTQANLLVLTPCGYDHLDPMGGYKGVEKCLQELIEPAKQRKVKILVDQKDVVSVSLLKGYEQAIQVKEEEALQLTDKQKGPWPYLWMTSLSTALKVQKEYGLSLGRHTLWYTAPLCLRGEWVYRYHRWIFQDVFNANRTSLLASLRYFWERWGAFPFICIIGEMQDLGKYSDCEHQFVLKEIKKEQKLRGWNSSQFVFIGSGWEELIEAEKFVFFKKKEELRMWVKTIYKKRILYMKGSRNMRLEDIIK